MVCWPRGRQSTVWGLVLPEPSVARWRQVSLAQTQRSSSHITEEGGRDVLAEAAVTCDLWAVYLVTGNEVVICLHRDAANQHIHGEQRHDMGCL